MVSYRSSPSVGEGPVGFVGRGPAPEALEPLVGTKVKVGDNVFSVPTVGVLLGVGATEGEVSSLLLVLVPDEL